MNKLAIALAIAICGAQCAGAQTRPAGPGVTVPQMGISSGLTLSFGHFPGSNHQFRRGVFPTSSFFDPAFWYEPAPPAQPSPPTVVVVPIQVTPTDEKREEEPKSAEPLLIERRGERFVRSIDGETDAGSSALPENVTSAEIERRQSRLATRPGAVELPPAVLVFRDGHREQTANYAIVGRDIYLYSDYLKAGSWCTKVSLADLDLIATDRENSERGSRFQLPHGPNEVVIRP